MPSNTKTTKDMLKQLAKMGKKKIGEVNKKEWREYNALMKKCLIQIGREHHANRI